MVGGSGLNPWDDHRRDVIRVAITLRPGNSGGALADIRGRIVGIPHMVVGPGLALAVPTRAVNRFLIGETVA
jgi:S1-C subfamily serine protease